MRDWLEASTVLAALLTEARATMAALGHEGLGFGFAGPGVLTATCTRCWALATIRVRAWGRPALSGAALAVRCRSPRPVLDATYIDDCRSPLVERRLAPAKHSDWKMHGNPLAAEDRIVITQR